MTSSCPETITNSVFFTAPSSSKHYLQSFPMHKPSSFISSITLVAFLQAQIASVWALPAAVPEQKPAPTLLYLGDDPYTQALLKLQYDGTSNSLEWQLINNGLVLTSQSHALPEATESVDSAVVYDGDQIVVAGRTSSQKWFIRALNSQGEFQWQRSGEGRVYDLAFSDDGQILYAVGTTLRQPLLLVINTFGELVDFHTAKNQTVDGDDLGGIYKQVVVTGEKEVVVARHWEDNSQLQLTKWQIEVDLENRNNARGTVLDFCQSCEQTEAKSVALKNDRKLKRFYVIVSNKDRLEFSIRDAANGESLVSQVIPIELSTGLWDEVFKVDGINWLIENPNSDINDLLRLATASGSKLQIFSSSCHVLLNSQMFDANTLVINICEDFAGALPGRRLLHLNNITEASIEPDRDFPHPEGQAHRVLIDWIGGLIGVISGIGLITGSVAFIWASYQKLKSIADKREEQEHGRQMEEDRFVSEIMDFNPTYLFKQHPEISQEELLHPLNLKLTSRSDQFEKRRAILESYRVKDRSESRILDQQRKIITENKQDQLKRELIEHLIIGDTVKVKDMIKTDNTLLNVVDSDGNTLLHYAASVCESSQEIIFFLLRRGIVSDHMSNQGFIPIMLAARAANDVAFSVILDHSLSISDKEISALFHISAQLERDQGLGIFEKLLVSKHHERLQFNYFNRYAGLMPCSRSRQLYSSISLNGMTILHEACKAGSVQIVEVILQHDLVGIDTTDKFGNTALHHAVMHEDDSVEDKGSVILCLLDKHADINAENLKNETPLHYAVIRDSEVVAIKLLTNKSIKKDIQNDSKQTPLQLAISLTGRKAMVDLLNKTKEQIREYAKSLPQQTTEPEAPPPLPRVPGISLPQQAIDPEGAQPQPISGSSLSQHVTDPEAPPPPPRVPGTSLSQHVTDPEAPPPPPRVPGISLSQHVTDPEAPPPPPPRVPGTSLSQHVTDPEAPPPPK